MKVKRSRQIFEKSLECQDFVKIRPAGAVLSYAADPTDRHIITTTSIVTFRKAADAPKFMKSYHNIKDNSFIPLNAIFFS
jgi:hypothetical protein